MRIDLNLKVWSLHIAALCTWPEVQLGICPQSCLELPFTALSSATLHILQPLDGGDYFHIFSDIPDFSNASHLIAAQ